MHTNTRSPATPRLALLALLAAALLAIASAVALRAQPTDTTPASGIPHSEIPAFALPPLRADPATLAAITTQKYPDADTVTVDNLTTTRYAPDGSYRTHDDTLVKILTEKGLRASRTRSFYYNTFYGNMRITLAQIIHPDGTTTPIDIAANTKEMIEPYQMGANIYDPNDKIVTLSLPGLKIGDTLQIICENDQNRPYIKDVFSGRAYFESSRPILHSTYEIRGPKTAPLRSIALLDKLTTPAGADTVTHTQRDITNPDGTTDTIHTWTARDIPQYFYEPAMPYNCTQRLLASTVANWEEISKWYARISEPHLAPTPEIRAKVAELLAAIPPSPSGRGAGGEGSPQANDEKIRAIFNFVSRQVRYMGLTLEKESPGFEPHDVSLTFNNRYGVCRDKAALLVTMLRVAGFDAAPVLINVGPLVDPEVPYTRFNHAITAIRHPDGTDQLLDSTNETTADLFPAYLCNKSYLVARPEGDTLRTSPIADPEKNLLRAATTLTIADDATLTGTTTLDFTGINDDRYRNYLAQSKPEDIRRHLETILKRQIPGATLTTHEITPRDLLASHAPLRITLAYTAPDYLTITHDKTLLATPRFATSFSYADMLLDMGAGLATRRFPLEFYYTCAYDETLAIHLPPRIGDTLALPDDTHLTLPAVTYDKTTTRDAATITTRHALRLRAPRVAPGAPYAALKDALKTIETTDRQLPILAAKPKTTLAPDTRTLTDDLTITLTDAHNWTRHRALRQQILTYAGKIDNAELRLDYNPVWETITLDHATVTLADGATRTVNPTEINNMDAPWVASAPRYPPGKTLVISLPGVEVGSTIETEVTTTCQNHPWFTLNETYFGFDPIDTYTLTLNAPATVNLTLTDSLAAAAGNAGHQPGSAGSAEFPLGKNAKKNLDAPGTTPGAAAPTVNWKLETVNSTTTAPQSPRTYRITGTRPATPREDRLPPAPHLGPYYVATTLPDPPAPAAPAINVNSVGATVSGMYVSGTTSYAITGNAITASATAGDLTGAVASGKLILGAQAGADGSTLDTAAAYTGTLTLSNTANTFENGIDILSGALIGNSANLATGAGGTTSVSSGASLTFNQVTTATYATPIAGSGALVKTGTAALTLAANSGAFAGTTDIAAGRLLLADAAALGGNITVRAGSTLGGTGTAGTGGPTPSTVTLSGTGATLQLGAAASTGATFSILGNLTLAAGSILDYTRGIANQLYVGGVINLTGTSIINIASTVTSGSYSLINAAGGFTGGTFDATLFDVNWGGNLLTAGNNYNLTYDGALVWLTMLDASAFTNSVLTWSGAAGGNLWFTSANWNINATGANKAFVQGDIINLADRLAAAAGATPVPSSTLALAGSATASAIYVSGTSSFAITGTGALVTATGIGQLATGTAATGKLTLGKNAADADTITTAGGAAFTGTLDLTGMTGESGANNFTQGIEINSGALRVSTTGQLGAPLGKLAFTGPAANNATLIIAGNMTFDGNNTAANILAIPNASAGAFLVEDGVTLTITRNTSNGNGGAANLIANSVFSIVAGSGANVIFTSNTAVDPGTGNINGGVFSVTSAGSKLTLTATANGATGGGFLFQNNFARGSGGAIFVNTGAAFVDSATFIGNSSTTQGGAVNVQAGASTTGTLILTNVFFASNTTLGNGGAIIVATNARATITNATFRDNVALGSNGGGALTISNGTNITNLTNASFTGNRATNNGGAIWFGGNYAILNLNVTAGGTSLFAANVSTTNATPNSIHFNNTANMLLTASVAPGGAILMLDPMSGAAATTTTISKIGAGDWFLGGSSTLGNGTGAGYTFNVNEGALHLYRDAETTVAYTRADGSPATAVATTGNLNITGNTSSFNLGASGTLVAGGGNTLAAARITFANNTTIALDLSSITAINNPALLTLSGTTLFAGIENINLFNTTALTSLALTQGNTFNLIALTTGSFASADIFQLNGAPDTLHYHLQLDSTNSILQLFYGTIDLANNVLAWNPAAGSSTWSGANWLLPDLATTSTYARYDIVNLTDVPAGAPAASSTITVDTLSVTLAGMSVSGNASYTLTGAGVITTSATAGGAFTGSAAATGKLILGASAAPDASAITTAPYTGTLTLSNTANTFTSGIDIRSGALVGNAASLNVGPGGTTSVSSGASLTFNQVTTATYATPIVGAGTLNKASTGTLTLAANNSAFTGVTNINAGSLRLPAASALGGAINVNSAATLVGAAGATAGAAGSTVTVNNAGTLQVGPTAAVSQTFTILGNLALNAGSILTYTSMDNQLLVGGNVSLLGASTINLGVTTLTTGSYSLIDALGGYTAGFNPALFGVTYKTVSLTAGTDYLLTTDPANLLWLTILNIPIVGNNVLTWNNAAGNNAWLGSKNWTTAGANTAFVQGDIVNLAGAAPGAIALASTATASAIYVSGTASYALSGPGALVTSTGVGELSGSAAATGKLTLGKNAADANTVTAAPFTGALDLTGLTGTNNFAQGIEINSGALRVATNAQLGTTLSKLTFASTGTLIAAGNMTFDSAGAATNRLNISATTAATFILEDGNTLTFANNNTAAINIVAGGTLTLKAGPHATYAFNGNVSNADGGAIAVGSGATLTLTGTASGVPGGGFLFTNNNTPNRGGAVFVTTAAALIDSATFNNNKNTSGSSTANGGALSAIQYSTLTLTDILFSGNYAGGVGGGLFTNSTITTAQNLTFTNNTSGTNGGALAMQGGSTMTLNGALFTGNSTVLTGGAIHFLSNNNTLNLGNALFTSNTAGTNGGAISLAGASGTLNLTDVSFIANTSGSAGGAIHVGAANNTITYNVSSGSTSQIAGNVAGPAATRAPNSIYFGAYAGLVLNVNVASGGSLDMPDPMTAADTTGLAITKTGSGVWNLGGANNLGATTAAAVNFTVNAGTLHLYRANETSVTPNGTFTVATPGSLKLTGGSFTLAAGATLSASGSNSITAPAITLAPGSTLALDMAAAAPNATSLLTLNATTAGAFNPNTWNQNLSLLNLAILDAATGDTFNLITLAGAAGATPFTTAAFNNYTNVTGLLNGYDLAFTPDGLTLQLSYSGSADNHVLTWTGATGNLWRDANWIDATGTVTTTARGDIVNLAGAGAAGSTATPVAIAINSPSGVAGMYVSGTQSYTLTGNSITASATIGTLAGAPAATGKLILGAKAAGNANAVNAAPFTGTLTLANAANLFTGGIDINTGALIGNDQTLAVGGGAGVTIAAPASLTFNQTASGTYAAPISGSGALAKTGAGALTLTANNTAFAGTTDINAGSLILAGATTGSAGALPAAALGGAITVDTGAKLAGGGGATAGAAGSTLAIAPGATLQVGTGTATAQQFNLLGNLSLGAGTLLDYTSITNQLLVGGAATLAGASTINLQTIATGSYSLINATGGLTGFTPGLFGVTYNGTLLDTDVYSLTTAGNQLWLTFTILPNNVITWTGAAGDGLWLTSTNWSVAGVSGNKVFHQGDIVNLAGATAASPDGAITLAATATAAAIYVSGSANYALAGSALVTDAKAGVLAGGTAANGKLTLGKLATSATAVAAATAFTGTLDLTGITGTNSFTGGIEIDSGALRVASNDQFGTTLGKLTFATGTAIVTGTTTLGGVASGTGFLGGMVVNLVSVGGGVEFAGNATFDGKNTNANRLVMATNNSAFFTLDDGVTLTIANAAPGANGGAINLGNRAALVIGGGVGAQVVFSNNNTNPSGNTTNYDGGAIYLTTNATLTLGSPDSTASFLFTGNAARRSGGAIYQNSTTTLVAYNTLFTGNKTNAGTGTSGNGGAIAAMNVNSRIFLSNAAFTGNTAFNGGGAIYLNTRATAIVQNGTFANNTASGANGGGALVVQGTAIFTATNVVFTGNTATANGGAIALATNGSKIDITTALFDSNVSGTAGGAINIANAGAARLADVSFTNNTAGTTGGAINVSGANAGINIQVSAGNTTRFAGNKAAGAPNSVYFAAVAGMTFNIDTAPGATLDMLDPLSAANAGLRIIKAGAGAWNLAGNNTFGTSAAGNTDFSITAGALHLYRAGEITADGATPAPATGNLAITLGSFTLADTATLALGGGAGGNTLTAPTISFSGTTTLALDLFAAPPNTPASAVLTLNNIALNSARWTQTLDLRDIDTLTPPSDGTTYNLITLAGTGAFPATYIDPAITNAVYLGLFTSATTFTLADALPAGYSLQITPDRRTLQLLYTAPVLSNTVLTTTAAANTLLGANWTAAGASGTFNRGDILNLVATGAPTTLAVNSISTATLAGLYVNGNGNTTITGANAIVADANATLLAGAPAATGKLALGAQAADNAGSVAATPYTGTLTLANTANTFLGGIEVNSGALIGNDKTLGSGTVGIAIAAAGAVTFNQTASGTYAAPISGAGALAKTGAATLTLEGNSAAFAGTTNVNAGRLLLDTGASLGGAINVNTAATLVGAGGATAAGSVAVHANGALQVGAGATGGQIFSIAGPLTLDAGAILDYTNNLTDSLHVGSASAAGPFTLNIADYSTTATYDLGNLAALAPNAQLTIAGATQYADARKQATLSTSGGDLILTTFRDASRVMIWTGSTNTTWALTGADWISSATGVFGAGDQVTFNDIASATPAALTVTVTNGIIASDMIVSGTSNYTFLGAGITTDASSAYAGAGVSPDTATGKLTKLGTGTLALNNTAANNFLGGIDLLSGALSIGGTTNAGAVTAADATTLAGNGTLRFASLTLTGGMVNAAIAPGNTLILTGTPAIASGGPSLATGDGGILKTGAGELRYSGAGAFGYTGITQLDQGTVRITDFAITGSTIVMPFALVPIVDNSIYVPSATFTVSSGVTAYTPFPNVISLGTVAPTTITLVNPSFVLSSTNVIPSATVTIGGVQTIIPSATVTMPATTVTIPNVTGTVIGSIVVIPSSSFTIPNYYQDASAVTQNMVLNGGTLALGTVSAAASGASGGNDSTANNWRGLRLIQADSATSSVISGVNDIVYIGAGTFAPRLTGGLHVAIDPLGIGDAGTGETNAVTTLGNSLNNFTGVVIAMSGTLQVTDKAQLGTAKAANNTQIAFWGGVVEFASSMTFAGDFAVRTATNTIVTDPGVNVGLTRIYRNAALTPAGAEFIKAGSGTLTLTGADQATALTANAGRIVITSSAGLPYGIITSATVFGYVTANNDAVIQFSPNLPGVSGTLGWFAGALYTPSVSGTIRNAFQGSGTLELTDSNLVLTNAKTTIAHINIGPSANVAVQATSFSPAGTITVDGGKFILAADNQTLGNIVLKNAATMGFLVSGSMTSTGFVSTFQALRNATIASLTATGNGVPNLWFNTAISDAVADHLTILAPVTGTFAINVTDWPYATTPDALPKNYVNIELINSPATTTGTFVIADSSTVIPIGAYNYDVTGTTNNGIYSVIITGNGDMSFTADAINAASAMLPMTWFSELDSISRRIGEIRFDDQAPKRGFSAWTSGYGEKLNFNGKLTGANFSARHLGGQAGLDYKFGGAASAYLGAYMGYGQTQRGYTATLADASNESVFGGIYATLVLPSGWYADAVFKLNSFRNRFTTIDPSSAKMDSADYRTWAAGGSLELGKRQTLPYDWNLTPMVQVAYTKVAAKSYATDNGIQVGLDSGATTQARVGFQFGRDIETKNHGTISAYVKGYYGRQWTHGGGQLITVPGLAPARFDAVIEGYGITGGAGLSWQFTKATQFYLDYETTQANYYIKPYGLNAGLRHTW